MNKKTPNKPKAEEIRLRRMEVERLHIWGHTVSEIAHEVGVDERTVSRDIQENRRERLNMIIYGEGSHMESAGVWLRNELADYIAFMDEAKRSFLEQSRTFKTEASKSRALWFAVQLTNQKVETIKSLMFSIDDIANGSAHLHEDIIREEVEDANSFLR
jgi:predicted transcriptional regulator